MTSLSPFPQVFGKLTRRDLLAASLAYVAFASPAAGETASMPQDGNGPPLSEGRMLPVNGLQMHLVEQGSGPLVILCHGWPELWFSWRHQLPVLADAGFHVVAPDLRGFGRTDAPSRAESYSIMDTVGDMVGLVNILGEREAIIVGHDWGATLAWTAALLRPDMFRAVAGLSVPFSADGGAGLLRAMRDAGRSNFYMLYFQKPGVAEAELERDPASTVRRMFAPPADPATVRFLPPGGTFLDGRPDPGAGHLPAWLKDSDIDYYAAQYRRTGYRGGLNWYRNMDRNGELLAPWDGAVIRQPAIFMIGSFDPAISTAQGRTAIDRLPGSIPGLRRTVIVESAGHWLQQERPAEVNAALLEFFRGL